MGEYNLILSSDSIKPNLDEIENKDLLYISYERNIPSPNRFLTISIYIDQDGKISIKGGKDDIVSDPSTIYFHLPISEDYNVGPPSYFPNYITLSSGQRYKYLNWLRNVDSPIDIGYVFLYYYGLERQLLIGKYEKAFNQIIRLRNVHKNKSFLTYSEAALIHSSIMRNRVDNLLTLHERTELSGFSNAQFLLAYKKGMALGPDNIINVFYKAFPSSRKNIKEDRFNMLESLKIMLIERFQNESFSISKYDLSKTKSRNEVRFANYSFPWEIRKIEITDFYECKDLMVDLKEIYDATNEDYKLKKRARKYTPEEIRANQLKKNIVRYKKLYSTKKIIKDEFELLQDFISQKLGIEEDKK
jgi:hypothetical protein